MIGWSTDLLQERLVSLARTGRSLRRLQLYLHTQGPWRLLHLRRTGRSTVDSPIIFPANPHRFWRVWASFKPINGPCCVSRFKSVGRGPFPWYSSACLSVQYFLIRETSPGTAPVKVSDIRWVWYQQWGSDSLGWNSPPRTLCISIGKLWFPAENWPMYRRCSSHGASAKGYGSRWHHWPAIASRWFFRGCHITLRTGRLLPNECNLQIPPDTRFNRLFYAKEKKKIKVKKKNTSWKMIVW